MKKKRILSLLLALCMVFSLFNAPALAAQSGSDVSAQSSADEDNSKKEEEERKKQEEEEARKKAEEEERKKAEEEARQKAEEEEREKAEEEARKKAEEEERKKAEEEAEQSSGSSSSSDSSDDNSGSSSGSDSSSSGSDSTSDGSASGSDGSASSSAEADSDAETPTQDDGGSSSTSQDQEDITDQEAPDEAPDEVVTVVPEEQTKEEPEEKQVEDKDYSVHAKLVSDVSGAQTMTAASFSDYSNSTGMAIGASVRFNRLITLRVTDLIPDKSSAGKKNLSRIESVMSWIDRQNDKKSYAKTMFKVVIPAGTYYIDGRYTKDTSRCIHLYSNTWLSMNGVTLIKSDTRRRAIIRSDKSKSSVSGYGGESNIILEGGIIDANIGIHKSKSMHFSGVRFGHDHDILIANVHFKGAVSGHHLELCGVKNISVVGCTFTDYRDTGYVKGINRNEAIQLDVTNGTNLTPTFAKYDDTITGNVVIYQNTFSNLSRAVGSHSALYGKYYDNIVIQNNTFKNVKNQAIHCENYRSCAITGNTITNCGGGVDFNALCFAPDGNYYQPHSSLPKYSKIKTYNAKTVISGNTITVKKGSSLTNASAIYVHGGKATSARVPNSYQKKDFRLTGVCIKNNVITRARSAGICLNKADNCTAKDNQISGILSGSAARGMGIYLESCRGGTLQNNAISDTKSHGIYLLSSKGSAKNPITVHGNSVDASKNTGSIGVYVKGSSYVDLTRNTVSARSYAVYLSRASTITIGERNAGNHLTSASKYGVYATGKSKKGVFVRYNRVSCTQKALHAAKGSKLTGSGNAVSLTKAKTSSKGNSSKK